MDPFSSFYFYIAGVAAVDKYVYGYPPNRNVTIRKIVINADEAPTGQALTLDITLDGSVQSRTATLAASARYQQTDITDLAVTANQYMGVKITQVGSTLAGGGIHVYLVP